jgi:hypothetical protein
VPPDPRLSRFLWQWLSIGALCLLLFPAARGDGLWLGWLPFWALIAPLMSLLVLHRRVLAAAWRGVLVPVSRRRSVRRSGPQARRLTFGHLRLRRPAQAA